MKISILIILICLSFFICARGQNSNEYKFVYKFQLSNPNDSSKILIDTLQNGSDTSILKGQILNSKSEPVSFLTIIVKDKNTAISAITNERGLFEIKVKPSTYTMSFTGVGYKTLTTSIYIETQKKYSFKIILATGNSLTWYDINSKKELSEKEIDEIKKCVQANDQNVMKCRKKNEYYVSIEI